MRKYRELNAEAQNIKKCYGNGNNKQRRVKESLICGALI